jgi:hypothetical protein
MRRGEEEGGGQRESRPGQEVGGDAGVEEVRGFEFASS